MSNTSSVIAIGTVYGDHSAVSDALSQFVDIELEYISIPAVAGPNDLVQILASIDGWKHIGLIMISIYGSGIISEAGKDTWRTLLAPRLGMASVALQKKLLYFIQALQKEKNDEQDVSIGLIEPTFDGLARRDRIYLTDLSSEEVTRHLYIFSHCAKPVFEWLSDIYASQTENGQLYVSMEISDEGTLIVTLSSGYCSTHPLFTPPCKRVFDAQGKIIIE